VLTIQDIRTAARERARPVCLKAIRDVLQLDRRGAETRRWDWSSDILLLSIPGMTSARLSIVLDHIGRAIDVPTFAEQFVYKPPKTLGELIRAVANDSPDATPGSRVAKIEYFLQPSCAAGTRGAQHGRHNG